MNEPLLTVFKFGVFLFQSILFVRFVCCIGFRQKIRHRVWLCILAAGLLTAGAWLTEGVPVLRILLSALILFVFSALCLEGALLRKGVVSLLPGFAAAAGSALAAVLPLLFPGCSLMVLTTLAANGILFAIYRAARAALLKKPAEISDAERPVLYAQLGCSAVLFLLLDYARIFSESVAAGLLLTAGILMLVLWDFAAYRFLAALHQKHREELESRLVKQEKSNQLRVDELSYQYGQLQKIRHDFKNTLSVISTLNAERKPAQIDAYIASYLNATHTSATFIASENEYANAIINAKAAQARQQGIEVKIVITSSVAAEDPVDICNVLGNMFDNAIAACRKITGSRRISLHIYDNGEETVFCMKNSIAHSVLEYNPDLRSDKADKANHGYGTRIIRETAAKYRGFADFYEESSEFCCNVVMYL